MRKRLRALGAACIVVAGASLAVSANEGCADKPAPATAPEPIVIGVSLGLTGSLDTFARPLRNAIEVAQNTINANGGILGRQVVFDVQDDQSDDGDKGIVASVANGFVQKHVVAVIGPIGSQQVVSTQDIYAKAQIPQLTPSATSTDLANIQPTDNRWLYRTTPADDFQGAAVILFGQRTPLGLGDGGAPAGPDGGAPFTCKNLAIVNLDNSYGNSMGDVIEQNWPKRSGVPVVIRKKLSTTLQSNYQDVANEVILTNPECLALITYDDVAAAFVSDFKKHPNYAGIAAKGFFFIGTDGVYTSGFLERGRSDPSDPTSPNIAEGVTGTNPDTQPGTPEYNQFRALYSSHYPLKAKEDAPAFAANTFDAAILIALAIQQAGNVDDKIAIRDALKLVSSGGKPYTPSQLGLAFQAIRQHEDIDYKGASGNVDLEPNGNVKAGFIVWRADRFPPTDPDVTKRNTLDYSTIGRFTLDDLAGQLQ